MSTHVTPNRNQIVKHFSKAKEVKCAVTQQVFDNFEIENLEFDKVNNSWTANNSEITLWINTNYAKITKRK